MNPIFSISSEEIQKLTDEQSRELVARLCRAELRTNGLSQAAVTWGGDQRAKDGGVDVRVDIDPPVGISGYIKRDSSAFQVKAESFSRGKVAPEMEPKGILRPAIIDLARTRGAYVIVSTRDRLSDSALADRIEAMEECQLRHGLSGQVTLDFYDCRRIADWVEQHPAIVNWVKSILGAPIIGWRPYSPWAYQESDIGTEYLLDGLVRVFAPDSDQGCDVLSAIDRLRGDLAKARVSVRIVGLSGVGKTRLVQALFDKRIVTGCSALDEENVLYTDLADGPTPQANVMVEAIVAQGADSVIVVDNCSPDIHQRLTEIIKRPNSKARLITIEYDIRDDLPEGTHCYRLDGSSDDVIKALLKRRFPILSDNDFDAIANFSEGNSRIAFALASTAEGTGELASLRDSELFHRLFDQKNVANDELLRCAEAASLLYSFDLESFGPDSELEILASLAEVSAISFSRSIADLQRRGLVQARGRWRAVLPHAISNRLAAHAVEGIPANILVNRLVTGASERIKRSFSRRLGYLHHSSAARKIVEGWLEPDGELGNLAKLDTLGRQVFANVAPVHQEAAIKALTLASANSDFLSKSNWDRAQFISVARSLAYDAALFDEAAAVLERFALSESPDGRLDGARQTLASLFYMHLSGTEALPKQRAAFVKSLLNSDDEARQALGTLLLEAALEASHFSSGHSFEFGARRRGYGWSPQSSEELRAWYSTFIDIAIEVGKTTSPEGRRAREILGSAVRGLWTNARLEDEVTRAAAELKSIDGWPEGWLGIRSVLRWDRDRLDGQSLGKLKEIERELAPKDLSSIIRARVAARGIFSLDYDDFETDDENVSESILRAAKDVEELGRAAARQDGILTELLPDLLHQSSSGNLWGLGFGAGAEATNHREIIEKAKAIVSSNPSTTTLVFLRGFIRGWNEHRPEETAKFLDEAIDDDIWGQWFPELQVQVSLTPPNLDRIIHSIELRKAPIWQYKYLAYGRVTDPLTVEQVDRLVSAIANEPNGLPVGFEILWMIVFAAKERSFDYRKGLAATSLRFIAHCNFTLLNGNEHDDLHLSQVLEFALRESASEENASEALRAIIAFERAEAVAYRRNAGDLLKPFARYFPAQILDSVYFPDSDGRYRAAARILRKESLMGASLIDSLPDNAIIEWCKVAPLDRCVFIANTCTVYETVRSDDANSSGKTKLSQLSLQLLSIAPEKMAILKIFIERLHPRSWSGSLSAVLRTRLPLLGQLNPGHDPALAAEISTAEELLRQQITAQEAHELSRDKERSERFE